MTPTTDPVSAPRSARPRLIWVSLRSALVTVLVLGLIGGAVAFAVLALTGQAIRLPPPIVERVETRLNEGMPPRLAVELTRVEVAVDDDWTPRLRLSGSRLMQDGQPLLTLPEAGVVFDPAAFASGRLLPVDMRLSGATVDLVRDENGQIDVAFGGRVAVTDIASARAAMERALASPGLSRLESLTLDALAIRLTDRRTGKVWQVSDGRLGLAVQPAEVAAELAFSLTRGEGQATGRLTVVAARDSQAARLALNVDGVEAADLAAQVPPLAALSVVDAPVSGQLTGGIGADGAPAAMAGRLSLGAGSLRPDPGAEPVPFRAASLALRYDPETARVTLDEGLVDAAVLTTRLTGHADLLDAHGAPAALTRWPAQIVAQLALTETQLDPPGVFAAPVSFSAGAADLRLQLNPFHVDIGQVSLTGDRVTAKGRGSVDADGLGWRAAVDLQIDRVGTADLPAIWPLRLVPKTREWFLANVTAGTLSDVQVALRLVPGAAPVITLQTDFSDAEVRVMRSMPPVTGGAGRATLENNAYVIALDQGQLTPPEGGAIALSGSTFRIPDVRERPNRAEVRLLTDSTATAALSLLDQPPFNLLQKAGRPVDILEGQARVTSDLAFPLIPKVTPADLTFSVAGEVTGVTSDRIVPGLTARADRLVVTADGAGVTVSGPGRLADLPFDVTWSQGIGPEARGASTLTGQITLTDAGLRSINVALPEGLLGGTTTANVTLDLPRGAPAALTLAGSLAGARLSIPALGYAQGTGGDGRLEVAATLASPPRVDRLEIALPGLEVGGSVRLRPGGGLDEAAFDRLVVGDWLEGTAVVTPDGARLTSGTIDLRRMPEGRGGEGGDGQPFGLTLDRLIVSDTIAFTDLRGEFTPRGGLNGRFRAGVNGAGDVTGTVVPIDGASAVRLQSDDAGTVLRAAGVFKSATGGTLDVTLVPQGGRGSFDGRAGITDIRVQNASVLAALLNAISVVGILEQLNGTGIVFNNVDVDFRLTPRGVEISRGAATGASLGVSMAGVYDPGSGQMDVQGVISPIYIVNGIGALFGRAGEGLFGFNYRMAGPAGAPSITVNPLSILTPGMFREIFRRPPPTIGTGG